MEKSLESIQEDKGKVERGKSRLLSPDPLRRKFVTEMLHAFSSRKISFAELTHLDPKKIKQVAEMGYVKLRHGRVNEARKIFEVLSFLDHKNYFHHLALGSAYQKMKRLVDAVFQYSEALKYNVGNTNALTNRGEVYLRQKNFRRAAEDFREAILQDTSGKDSFANRARSLVIAIKRQLAREKELKAKGIEPALPQPQRKKISPLKLVTPTRR